MQALLPVPQAVAALAVQAVESLSAQPTHRDQRFIMAAMAVLVFLPT